MSHPFKKNWELEYIKYLPSTVFQCHFFEKNDFTDLERFCREGKDIVNVDILRNRSIIQLNHFIEFSKLFLKQDYYKESEIKKLNEKITRLEKKSIIFPGVVRWLKCGNCISLQNLEIQTNISLLDNKRVIHCLKGFIMVYVLRPDTDTDYPEMNFTTQTLFGASGYNMEKRGNNNSVKKILLQQFDTVIVSMFSKVIVYAYEDSLFSFIKASSFEVHCYNLYFPEGGMENWYHSLRTLHRYFSIIKHVELHNLNAFDTCNFKFFEVLVPHFKKKLEHMLTQDKAKKLFETFPFFSFKQK